MRIVVTRFDLYIYMSISKINKYIYNIELNCIAVYEQLNLIENYDIEHGGNTYICVCVFFFAES